jgi:hypothetical protein
MNYDKVLGYCESYSGLSDSMLDICEDETIRAVQALVNDGKIEKHVRSSGVVVWHTTDRAFPRRP